MAVPQARWAAPVIDRLDPQRGEAILDAGCGSGRVTAMLAERQGEGRLVGVDGSSSMIGLARELLGDRAELVHSDLLALDPADLGRFDAIFSNAVFHWIADHDTLFAVLATLLEPGGRIAAQCGGAGNVASFYAAASRVAAREPFAPHVEGFEPTYFARPEETERRLLAAGFTDAECWLEDQPVQPPEPREFVRSVCLGAHSERLPEELRMPFLDAVMEELGPDPVLGYVRLNITAHRPGVAGPGA